MEIAVGVNKRLGVFDIETYIELFDVGVYDPDTKEWFEWEVSAYKNELVEFINFYRGKRFDLWVSFNGIGFDNQVLEWVLENYGEWGEKTGLEIAGMISEFGSRVIEDQGYDLPLPYYESEFSVGVMDLFRIHHMDNEARRTSLKWCEYMMNMDVEEMPVDFKKTGLTRQEIDSVISYRRHDVMATLGLLYLTLGRIDLVCSLVKEMSGIEMTLDELNDYRGKNKIQDRIDVMEETGMNCLNWSDVKIGEEWNKLNYTVEAEIKDVNKLYERKPRYPFGQPFKNFFPKSMVFTTKKFQDFIRDLGEQKVLPSKQEFSLTVGKTTHMFAKGGIHSNEKNRIVKPPEGYLLITADVDGQYPNFIIKEKIHAPHLNDTIIRIAKSNVDKRTKYKALYKELKAQGKDIEARPYDGLQGMLKLCNNGGLFGKLGQEGSFLHSPEGLLRVCVGNEIEILMLIEALEDAGFNVVSSNTDGCETILPTARYEEYKKICVQWQDKVGNVDNGKLSFDEYEYMCQDAVNSYIAKKKDGSAKKKGRFLTQFELNKNKSSRIIAMALEEYFMRGVNPIEYITNHKNIFDFCIGRKAGRNPNGLRHLWYEELGEEVIKHEKILRYYIGEEGVVIKKRGFDDNGDKVDDFCEADDKEFFWMPQPLLKNFNKIVVKEMADYKINYPHYILKTLKRIDKIQGTKMAREYANTFKAKQYSLF